MPSDSGATWRYRIYDVDYITHIIDFILFLNGEDTIANGNIYHKIISRSASYIVPNGTNPPVVPVNATYPDIYYGAMRESGKEVYLLNGPGETLMFNFNAVIGSSVPSYSGTDEVVGIDSVFLLGIYHKRYLTTDTGYYIIEGVGSSRGLIPQINDGGGDMAFYCFTDSSVVTFSPDTTVPCTYIYPIGYVSSIAQTTLDNEIKIYPVPVFDIVNITSTNFNGNCPARIVNYLGQVIWSGLFNGDLNIAVSSWQKGLYYFQFTSNQYGFVIKKFIVQ